MTKPIEHHENLRASFTQASENARVYMDLRFKHFGTFILVTGLLGTAIFQIQVLSDSRLSLAAISIIFSILFWLLDFRTAQYFKCEIGRIRFYKKLLKVPRFEEPKHILLLRASTATNLIFLAITVMWLVIWSQLYLMQM